MNIAHVCNFRGLRAPAGRGQVDSLINPVQGFPHGQAMRPFGSSVPTYKGRLSDGEMNAAVVADQYSESEQRVQLSQDFNLRSLTCLRQ